MDRAKAFTQYFIPESTQYMFGREQGGGLGGGRLCRGIQTREDVVGKKLGEGKDKRGMGAF